MADFTKNYANLAEERLGAKVVSATDDFFAPKERLIDPADPVFIPGKYDDHGKWMDGWESRRKRTPGYDHCVIKLGQPSRLFGADIDTSHFNGNQPPEASLQGCSTQDVEPKDDDWLELVAKTPLQGNAHHLHEIHTPNEITHVRLNIFPDGGVARLRLYGVLCPAWDKMEIREPIDMAAIVHGGRPIACNNEHFGKLSNLIAPPPGQNMGDGWETRRRRKPGHDWAVLALGAPTLIDHIIVDTAYFKGNYPDRCSLQAALNPNLNTEDIGGVSQSWETILGEQKLEMDAKHRFDQQLRDIGAVSHVRLNIIPDGGVSRLHVFGRPAT